MEAKPYKPENHSILASWWVGHGWNPVPQDHLPEIGFISWKNTTPIAAGFLYKTDSKFGVMEWLLADIKSDTADRDQALDLVLQALFNAAKENNIKSIYTTTNHKRLIERYKANGCIPCDENTVSFLKRIE